MQPLIKKLHQKNFFLKCSHRGGLGLYPENTMFAFSNTLYSYGVDMIELDLQFTKDQKVIVLHDSSIDRTTNGQGNVSNLNYSDISIYDAGYNFYNSKRGYVYRNKGIKIPLFEDVLKNMPNIYLNIELKKNCSKFAKEVCRLICKYKFENKIIIGSGKFIQNNLIRKLLPNSCHYLSKFDLYLLIIASNFKIINKYWKKFDVMEVPMNYYDINVCKFFIRLAEKINKPIIFWGANDKSTIKMLSEIESVQGIITDFPNYFMENKLTYI